jgi:para-aminobenzoate synthetase component 1
MDATLLKHPLIYCEDSSKLFARLSQQPWAMMLDSGQPRSQYGRYDIFVAEPLITLRTLEADDDNQFVTEICQDGKFSHSHEDPFEILNQTLLPFQAQFQALGELKNLRKNLPFVGGAVGYFAYDLGRKIEKLPNLAQKNPAIPHMMVGIYDWALVVDHREKTACLVSNALHSSTRARWQSLCDFFDAPANPEENLAPFTLTSEVTSNMDFPRYEEAFTKIKNYIRAGDCYQVNLAQRFSAQARGNAWQAYQKLREISSAPFMAYMNFVDVQVLSGSPERFLQVVNNHVETRPIKGTRPRSANPVLDKEYAAELQASLKDRAENVMIVDLLRNDIGKNCAFGSVKADQLFQLQSFANVHHLVSIVTGKLAKAKTAIDLLRGCFPGGSITGAPKLRAMEIIEELEPHRRGVYCGAIGYIGFDGNMDTNIAIRTAVYAQGEVSFYAGGGIVADSVLEKEYAETLDKASSIMKVMQFFKKT